MVATQLMYETEFKKKMVYGFYICCTEGWDIQI